MLGHIVVVSGSREIDDTDIWISCECGWIHDEWAGEAYDVPFDEVAAAVQTHFADVL